MTTRRQSGSRSEFLTIDPAEAEEHLTKLYSAPVRLRADDGAAFRLWHVRLGAGPLHVDTLVHTATIVSETDPVPGVVPVIRGLAGTRTDLDRGLTTGRGGVVVAAQPGHPHRSRVESASYSVAMVPLAAVAAAAVNRPDEAMPPLWFATMLPSGPAAARRWAQAARYAAAELRDHPEAASRPLADEALTRLLAVTLLDVFPSNWADPPPESYDRTDATPVTLARAMAFIESNAGSAITMTDVARDAGVTVRAVQLAFRRHTDTTPWTYLRRVRLEYAREELIAAEPGTTVAAVAARWGWADPDRFAAAYRALFGERPSATLRG